MHYRVLENEPQRRFAVVFDQGDEVVEALSRFAKEQHLDACRFTGEGAFSYVMLGRFDWEQKIYQPVPIEQRVEVISLVGNITPTEESPVLDMHVAVALPDGVIHGGHVLEAYVKPQFELTVVEEFNDLPRVRKDRLTAVHSHAA